MPFTNDRLVRRRSVPVAGSLHGVEFQYHGTPSVPFAFNHLRIVVDHDRPASRLKDRWNRLLDIAVVTSLIANRLRKNRIPLGHGFLLCTLTCQQSNGPEGPLTSPGPTPRFRGAPLVARSLQADVRRPCA